ncbi:MAG: MATE family efflux transporter [Clostridiales bacterium]|nr:MATE family efflux transporter [Clostridiales bacterium]
MGNSNIIFSKENTIQLLMRFAVPAVISLLVVEIYGMVDTVFVGRYIGANAIAALTIAFPIQKFLSAIGLLIAIGTSTHISRNLGEKNSSEINKTIMNSFFISTISMLMVPFIIFVFRSPILYKLGASNLTYSLTEDYSSIVLLSGIFQCFGMVMCYVLISFGKTKVNLYANTLGVLVNITLNYILVVLLQVGIKGAAVSTVVSQATVCAFAYYHFREVIKYYNIKLCLSSVIHAFNKNIIKSILAIGFSTFVVEISDAVGTVILNNLLYSSGGDNAITIIGAVTKVSMFMFIIIIGISSAMQPIAAYNYGAGKMNKVKETVYTTIKMVIISSVALVMLTGIFTREILGFFLKDKEILEQAVKAFRICIALIPLTGVYYVLIYYYQAIGQAKRGFLLSIFKDIIAFIPVVIVLVQAFGTLGAWLAYPATDILSALVSVYLLIKPYKDEEEPEREEKLTVLSDKNMPLVS